MRYIIQLENKIKNKLDAISRREIEVKDSGVNNLLKSLKPLDLASYENLQQQYINVVKSLK